MEGQQENQKLVWRCHFSSIIEASWKFFATIAAVVFYGVIQNIGNMRDLEQGVSAVKEMKSAIGYGLLALFAIFGVYLFIMINRWRKTTVTVDDSALIIKRDTMFKKENTIGIKNISSVNMEQNIFEMFMGTYKIKLDTNSLSTASTTDVQIILNKENATLIKNEIMKRMKKMKQGHETTEVLEDGTKRVVDQIEDEVYMDEFAESDYDIKASVKDIIMHCVYTTSVISIVITVGVIIAVVVALVNISVENFMLDTMKDILGGMIAAAFALFAAVQSMVKDLFRLYHFRVKRAGDRIYMSYGALKKQKFAIPVEKINAVIVSQNFISRLFHRCQLKVVNVGTGEQDNQLAQLLFTCTLDQAKTYMKQLLPEYTGEELEYIKQDKKVRSIYGMHIVLVDVFFAIGVAILYYFMNSNMQPYVMWIGIGVFAFITIMQLFGCYLKNKVTKIGINEKFVNIVTGRFDTQQTLIRYGKIQYMEIESGPITKIVNLKKANINILAPALYNTYVTGYFEEEQFESLHQKMVQSKSYI